MFHRSRFPLFLAALLACTPLATPQLASAQELRHQATPFTVWLDFAALTKPDITRLALPIWLESVVSDHPKANPGDPQKTVFRMRLRRLGELNKELQMRLFFEDDPQASPSVTAWTETGALRFESGPLGTNLGVSSSAELLIPAHDVDYLEIAVDSDGTGIHGAFLTTVSSVRAKAPMDFAKPWEFLDPFGRAQPTITQEADSYLFGRVRAALLAEAVKLTATEPIIIDFQLDRTPQLAMVTFEVLNADVAAPPDVSLNQVYVGQASVQLPDLADPAYRGQTVPMQADQRFRYSGWLRCSCLVPASALKPGISQIAVSVGRNANPVGIRALEIQLKYPWDGTEGK